MKPPAPIPAWPLSSSIVASLAVAAVVGLANIVLVLDLAGGEIGGRLLAVLPIYFIAAFAAAQLAFWLLRASVGRLLGLGVHAPQVRVSTPCLFDAS